MYQVEDLVLIRAHLDSDMLDKYESTDYLRTTPVSHYVFNRRTYDCY